MNKILLGVLLGAVLGVFDGLTALFTPDPGFLFALFVALGVHNYYARIIIPGTIVGLIVGYATQRYGASAAPATR